VIEAPFAFPEAPFLQPIKEMASNVMRSVNLMSRIIAILVC